MNHQDYYAKKMAEQIDRDIYSLYLGKGRKPRALTRRQRRQLFIQRWRPRAVYHRMGERVTRRLMRHFDIYENDDY